MTPFLSPTRIYVDADACPVKDEIYRVAARHALPVSVVAGQFIRVPQDPLIERIAAGSGMDAADDWIAERAGKGDIVITSDIPLASRCVKAGAEVIAPNGKPFTEQSIGMTLAVRNLMTDLRSSGEITGGRVPYACISGNHETERGGVSTPAAIRGGELFRHVGCGVCHVGSIAGLGRRYWVTDDFRAAMRLTPAA